MEFVWDEAKNQWLKSGRLISFVKHPTRSNQRFFVLRLREYTWLVPFVVDENSRIVLKTAFPSRKYHKKYGGDS